MGFLEDLDEQYLPGLARRLDDALRRVRRVTDRIPRPPDPAGPAPLIVRLRRVDDRWTRSGPLAMVREVPQLGAVVIAAVLLAGSVTVRARTHPETAADRPGTTQQGNEPGDGVTGTLGPKLGENVPSYIRDAKSRLVKLSAGQPDGIVLAVVSFRKALTPEQVRDLMGPAEVKRIFFRAPMPLDAATQRSIPVDDVVRDSRKAFTLVAAAQARMAAELNQINPTITNDPVTKAAQEKDARNFAREAKLLRGHCACVFAVVVRAKINRLLDLNGRQEVRVIDASPIGAKIQDYDFTALMPEETKVVTGGDQDV